MMIHQYPHANNTVRRTGILACLFYLSQESGGQAFLPVCQTGQTGMSGLLVYTALQFSCPEAGRGETRC
jgi:hypothetical protein